MERAAESVLGRVRGEEGKRVGPGVRGKGLGRAGRELGLGFWEVGWKTGLGLKHGLGWETEFWARLFLLYSISFSYFLSNSTQLFEFKNNFEFNTYALKPKKNNAPA